MGNLDEAEGSNTFRPPFKMKSNDPLHEVLKSWRVDAPLPPGFERGVWQRIERSRSSPAPSFWRLISDWIANTLPRPALAVSYIATLAVIGVGAGWGQARQETTRIKGEISQRYVQTLDPYFPAQR